MTSGPGEQIPDRAVLFAEMGEEQVERQADLFAGDATGQDVPGECYLAKAARLRMARFDAQAPVLRDLVRLTPE